MAELFPDPYMHVGGDENNGVQWKANPRIQEFAKKHDLKDTAALQTYFNQRLWPILQKHGKRMIGWDENERFPPDFVGQTRQLLKNIAAVLAEGGAAPQHIVRMTWYVRDMDEYLNARPALGEIYREVMGDHYPAMALVAVTGLVEPEARLEIETTAVVPD